MTSFDPVAQLDHITTEGQLQAWIDARRAAGWPEELIGQVLDSWVEPTHRNEPHI